MDESSVPINWTTTFSVVSQLDIELSIDFYWHRVKAEAKGLDMGAIIPGQILLVDKGEVDRVEAFDVEDQFNFSGPRRPNLQQDGRGL